MKANISEQNRKKLKGLLEASINAHMKELCEAFGLKMLPTCKSVLKGVCGKVNCRNENGQKPCIILAACNLQTFIFF